MNVKSSYTLLLTLAFLGTAALADFADLADDLEDDVLVNRRLVNTPEWFERIKDSFSEPGTELKKCGKLTVAPTHNAKCGRKSKTCFFGTQKCLDVGAHPVTKCSCIAKHGRKGVWACDDEVCPKSPLLDTPEWFGRIKDSYSDPGTQLKKCSKLTVAPTHGAKCGRKRKTCFFGTQQCSGVGAHPVTKCSCIGEINKKGEWACDDEVCQENDEDTIVQAASGVFRSSPARALDVTMNLLTPAVLQGYDNIEDLSDDLNQAVRFYVNSVIEQQALHNNRFSPLPFVIEPDDQVVFAVTSESKTTASPSAEGATDFETNNQEEGVDEADKVKSDGMYTYAAYGDVVVVWNVITGDLVANYTLPQLFYSDAASGTSFLKVRWPFFHHRPKPVIQAMSLEAQRLVLYVQGYGSEVREQNKITSVFSNAYETRIMVLDTSTLPLSLTFVTQEDVQGSYRDARAIGSDIHLVTSASINYYALTGPLYRFNSVFADMDSTEYKKAAAKIAEPLIDDFVATLKADVLLNGIAPSIPKISIWQSDLGNNTNIVEQIYKEGAIQAYVQLTSFAVKGLDGALSLSVAGAFTPSSWGHTYAVDGNLVFAAQGWNWSPFLRGSSQTTYLLGFSLNGASAAPAYLGSVPGYILNQYSLSAYEGHLRVAATVDTVWPIWEPIEDRNGDIISPLPLRRLQNSVHILKIPSEDESVLHEVANIPNLGKKGERFTAVRFFGNICYAGTFVFLLSPSCNSVTVSHKMCTNIPCPPSYLPSD